MSHPTILDTGVLIAMLLPKDKFHAWAVEQLSQATLPIITNEAVITEACFLAQRIHQGPQTIIRLLRQGHITTSFSLHPELESIENLMQRYSSVPMSFADACLVRMSELYDSSPILTLDSDFLIYRKHRNQMIPAILPPQSEIDK